MNCTFVKLCTTRASKAEYSMSVLLVRTDQHMYDVSGAMSSPLGVGWDTRQP